MSVRHASANAQPHVAQLQKELNDLKATAIASNAAYRAAAANPEATPSTPTFEQLSGVEQSAASLGVHPDNAHYEQLRKSNALDDNLARRIDAYKQVATSSA